MDQTGYDQARSYALNRLEHELDQRLIYHNIAHTRDDVLPAAERIAELEGVSEADLTLLRTAVLFHDIGFVETYQDHESVSIRIAQEVLPGFGFSPQQVDVITRIIQATRLPQSPHTLLEKIMADADLDVLGRQDLFPRNRDLRNERKTEGQVFTDIEWFSSQLSFLRGHSYFTDGAHMLRAGQKLRNIDQMAQMLEAFQTYYMSSNVATESDPGNILSIPERIAILHAVSLFSETPDKILAEVAALLTPVVARQGQTVIRKGDPGDSMYIIVRGHIQIHDGEMQLNRLGPADVFGEMAILDDQPRVASGTALEETQLLRLAQQTFYQLMDERPEVARGVIRVLNRNLRGRVRDMAEDFEYIQQVGRITAAAAALEAGVFDPSILDQVCERVDELGQLARVFQKMANEVQAREQRLKQEVMELRIQIDEVKKAQQVAEITESEYFQELQSKISRMKKR